MTLTQLCPRCSSRLHWIADRDEAVCFLGHRTTGQALHTYTTHPIKILPAPRTPNAVAITVLGMNSSSRGEQELKKTRDDYKRDLAQTIYGEETRMEYRTSVVELLDLVNAGLLTKVEGRLIALEMFPVVKKAIADRAVADASKLPAE